MIFYGVRTVQTKEWMPEYKSGKGYSYWLLDNKMDNQKKVPRLLESRRQAEKVIVEWAKGVFEWKEIPDENGNFQPFNDVKRVMVDKGRTKDMLEVFEIEIKDLYDF